LSAAERAALLDATRGSADDFRGLTGDDRYHLYLTAAGTGLRLSELATLTPESFNLFTDPPVVTVGSAYTKNKKPATQPLPSGVAHAIRLFLPGRPAGAPVWPGTWSKRASEMLRADLAAANVPYVVKTADGPTYADFHSLRHGYIAAIVRTGATVKQAQALARHSDPKLTIGVYSHATLPELAGAADRLALAAPAPTAADDEHETVGQLAAFGLLLLAILSGRPAPVALPVALTVAPTGDGSGLAGTKGRRPRSRPSAGTAGKQAS
jgi:integrase